MTHAVKDVLDEYENYLPPFHTASSSNNNFTQHGMSVRLTPVEERKVLAMRQRASLLKDLTSCIAPNIFKHEVVKLGLLLQMVGGVSKTTV